MQKKKQKVEKKVKIKFNPFDKTIFVVVLLLVAFGFIMVLSASAPSALAEYNDSYRYFRTQVLTGLFGVFVMIVASYFDYRILTRTKIYIFAYIFGVAMIFSVLTPFGVEVNGARRWINVGLQLQPSEITKICTIVGLAGYYSDKKWDFNKIWYSTVIPFIATVVPVLLLYKIQNHLSAGILIFSIGIIIMCMSGVKSKDLIKTFLGFGAAGALLFSILKDKLLGNSFRGNRITAWLDPWSDSSDTGYQTIQSLYAIGSGGLFGVGLGKSKQKYLYIPEAHNDFIFAIIAEELGFVGCATVIILFAVLIVRGVYIAACAKEKSGTLMGVGIITMIAVQVILNIAVVTNTIPNTGISLPFLSYGGSSLIILLGSIGLLLNISRTNKKYEREK